VQQLFKVFRSSTRASALKIEKLHGRVKIFGWPKNYMILFLVANFSLIPKMCIFLIYGGGGLTATGHEMYHQAPLLATGHLTKLIEKI
jgi:hypothetical protein